MRACMPLAVLLILAGTSASCSRPNLDGPGEPDQARTEQTPPSAAGDPTEAARQQAANAKLASSISVAEVYFRHGEYDEAEKALRDALADPAATDRTAALALLEKILTKRSEAAARQTAASSQPPLGSLPEPRESPGHPTQTATIPVESPPAARDQAETAEPETPAAGTEPVAENAPAPESPTPEKIIKVPAEDEQITALVQSATDVSAPGDALRLYADFMARHTLTAEQEKRIDRQLEIWRERSEKRLVRFGARWVSPEEARAAADRASAQITGALAAIEEKELRKAVNMLKRASTTDPGGIRADFILGMLHSVIGSNDPITARQHFRTVLARSPENVAALNNLALAEIKLREFDEAYRHLKRAVEISPATPEVIQNLGRLVSEIKKGKLPILPDRAARFEQLYGEALNAADGQRADLAVGWLYAPQVLTEVENDAEEDRQAGAGTPSDTEGATSESPRPKPALPLVAFGSASGFVVHHDYILTNRHVVHDERYGVADVFRIVDPTDPTHTRTFDATFVAMSRQHDMALLKCPDLKAAPVPLAGELPKRGTDVLVLGYPRSGDFGRNLKVTRGIVTALPDAGDTEFRDMLLFDAEANPGNSGGPVCDQFGRAIAMMTFITGRLRIGQYSGGLPSASIIPFVRRHIPAYQAPQSTGPRLDWPDVDATVSPSTVLILVYHEGVPFDVTIPDQPTIGNARRPLEDVSCSVCKGYARNPCPRDGCIRGVITVTVNKQVVRRIGDLKTVVNIKVPVKNPCPTCNAVGTLDCQFCNDGTDPSLSSR